MLLKVGKTISIFFSSTLEFPLETKLDFMKKKQTEIFLNFQIPKKA